ncbi:hypothetical protein DRQ23_03720 [bacterium]|nr:MAG: hypothetical protein DRQ23_03720 [bacterium]
MFSPDLDNMTFFLYAALMKAKITYPGAYHHVMNRGVLGIDIFADNNAKQYFLDTVVEKIRLKKAKLLCYCVMDNHYHLLIKDCTGNLSSLMRAINGNYAIYYRKRFGGKGYVFQNRYKSILVEKGLYLKMVTAYILLNPLRAGKVKDVYKYLWSSIREYYDDVSGYINAQEEVEELFEDKESFDAFLKQWALKGLPLKETRMGTFLGSQEFIAQSVALFDRRKKKGRSYRMRKEEDGFVPPERLIKDFEETHGIKIGEIDTSTRGGKRLRDELLIGLREESGLTFKQIIKIEPFKGMKYSSLGQMYRRAKKKKMS